MNEVKHTPGPWLLVETPDEKMISSWHIQVGDDRVSVFPYTRQYSQCRQYSGLITDHQKMADAKLIAAAPDLLSELEETHAALCFTADYIGSERYKRNAAAIAKATQ